MKTVLFSQGSWQYGSQQDPSGREYRFKSYPATVASYFLPDSFYNWGCVMLLCLIGCWGGVKLGQSPAESDIFWPANGVVLAALLTLPRRFWTSYLLGSFLSNMLIHVIFPFPLDKSLIFSAANALEIFTAAACLSWRHAERTDFSPIRALGSFFVQGVILAPLVSTVFVQLMLISRGIPAGPVSLFNWFMGDALGIAIMTPLIRAMDRREISVLLGTSRRLESAAILSGITALSAGVFAQNSLPTVFILFPAFLLAIFRLGSSGAAVGIFLMVVPAACFTIQQRGPFAPAMTGSLLHSIWFLQCFLSVLLVTIYSVCAALSERDRLQLELKAAYQEAHVHAGVDHVTGLANRRTFDEQLALEWRRAVLESAGVSLMMIDVDRFKLYNDHYGHLAGDACLAALGAIFQHAPLRETDLAVRYGGEEFAVILPRAASEGAVLLADRIRQAVADQLIPHLLHESGIVTISVGVATVRPGEETSVSVLIERADQALYEAKRAGGNQVKAWSAPAPGLDA